MLDMTFYLSNPFVCHKMVSSLAPLTSDNELRIIHRMNIEHFSCMRINIKDLTVTHSRFLAQAFVLARGESIKVGPKEAPKQQTEKHTHKYISSI